MSTLARNYRSLKKGIAAQKIIKRGGIIMGVIISMTFVLRLGIELENVYMLLISPFIPLVYCVLMIYSYKILYRKNVEANLKAMTRYSKDHQKWDIYSKIIFLKNLLFFDSDLLYIHQNKINLDTCISKELRNLNLNIQNGELDIIEEFYEEKLKYNKHIDPITLTALEANKLEDIYSKIIISFQKYAINGRFKDKKQKTKEIDSKR